MTARKERVVTFRDRPPDCSVYEFQSWLSEQISAAPDEYRSTARIEFTIEYSYGDAFIEAMISYQRQQTVEEANKETADREWSRKSNEERERAMLRALQSKYGE